ncbi:hypothetical protein HPP92_024537 [Vanilla planifolia]|uniref:CAAX prenyl protease 2/Lysostaphin resistance protein A-like domain-containing protein n=1 Tax=Vanilla planifolia TaxID=51239 RepID=A0A835UBM2_VANPL|nr:hypothetical protein HPP92_024537 [Vanilla planifolia]
MLMRCITGVLYPKKVEVKHFCVSCRGSLNLEDQPLNPRMWALGTSVVQSNSIHRRYLPISGKDSARRSTVFAEQKSEKKVGNVGKISKNWNKQKNLRSIEFDDSLDSVKERNGSDHATFAEPARDNLINNDSLSSADRISVLKACTITSGLLLSLGLLLRQVAHAAYVEGWPIHDALTDVTFEMELWHIQLIAGIVVLISSTRYMLLKIWPEFSESSESSNQKVLGLLQPLDFVVVSVFSGISEELLFRGALLPLLGLSWKCALIVGAIFGVLHLSGGRSYSIAIWASFVGFTYGMATIVSSNVIVPMASHSLNNLIGGILWRFTSSSQKKIR